MRTFGRQLTASVNLKGVLDIDTVKGCAFGMAKYPHGGCYGVCYAHEAATCRGFDFTKSISRCPADKDTATIERQVCGYDRKWFRIGVMGDPSHDWPLTLYVCEWLGRIKRPVIVTKHWRECPSEMLRRLAKVRTVFNTSISAMDTEQEREHRLDQYFRVMRAGCSSWLRIVTAEFGGSEEGRWLSGVQAWLLMHSNIIDNPLRIPANDRRVRDGTIIARRMDDIHSKASISKVSEYAYVGKCNGCPDQCGTVR